MAEAAENPITPTGLLGHVGTTDVGTVTPPAVRTLLNVADGATANSSDTALRDRTTHTGTQATSTVTGLDTALAGKAPTSHTHTLANITDAGTLAGLSTVGTAQLTNDAVTLAKIQNAAANSKLLGSGAAGAGTDYAELTLGTNLSISGTTLNATGGGGLPNAVANSRLLGSGAAGAGAAYSELSLGTNLTMAGTTLNAAATAASDSETVTYLAPFTGSVSRTTESKLSDIISLKDFGAVMNGSTNDTAAWNLALAYIVARGSASGSRLLIDGMTVVTPSSLNWKLLNPDMSTRQGTLTVTGLVIELNGLIRVTDTLIPPAGIDIIGISGAGNNGFMNQTGAMILKSGAWNGPVVQLAGSIEPRNRLQNIQISTGGSGDTGACIRIGFSGTETGYSAWGQTAFFWLEYVGCMQLCAGESAVEIFNAMWVWVNHFSFGTSATSYASVRIGGGGHPGAGLNSGGLIQIENGMLSSYGIVMDRNYGPPSGYEGAYVLKNIVFENARGPLMHLKISGGGVLSQISMDNCEFADAIAGIPAHIYLDPTNNALVQSVFTRMCPMMAAGGIRGNFAQIRSVQWDAGSSGIYSDARPNVLLPHDLDVYPRASMLSTNSASTAMSAFLQNGFNPSFVPAGCSVGTPSVLSSLTCDLGTGTVTAGKLAPDGSTGAIEVAIPSFARVQYLSISSATTNDLVAFGVMTRWVSGAGDGHPRVLLYSSSATGIDGGAAQQAEIGASAFGFSGWGMVWECSKCTAAGTLWLHVEAQTNVTFQLYAPFIVVFPASAGWKRQDIVAYATHMTGIPQAGGAGVTAQMPGHTFKTGRGATGSRPSASAVGAGAQWFDTTLNQPIWSNGTAWATATGGTPAIVSSINGQIETVAVKTYTLDIKAAAAYTINSLTTKSGAGSCTAAIQIDGTPVTFTGGGTAHTTTETEYPATAANSVAAGQTVNLVVSAISSCTDLVFTLKTTG